jgi:hypothetical protein
VREVPQAGALAAVPALRLDLVREVTRPLWVDVVAGVLVVLAAALVGLVLGTLLMYGVLLMAYSPPG